MWSLATNTPISYKQNRKLSGVIYLHRITDPKMGGVSRRSFRMMSELCGDNNFRNTVIVTNMWDKVSVMEGRETRGSATNRSPIF